MSWVDLLGRKSLYPPETVCILLPSLSLYCRRPNQVYRCPEDSCPYYSHWPSDLKRHIRVHTGEKPYPCPHCAYRAAESRNLQTHLRIHSGEKPFKCDAEGCDYRSTQASNLRTHMKIHAEGGSGKRRRRRTQSEGTSISVDGEPGSHTAMEEEIAGQGTVTSEVESSSMASSDMSRSSPEAILLLLKAAGKAVGV